MSLHYRDANAVARSIGFSIEMNRALRLSPHLFNEANLQSFRLISLAEDENLVFRGNSFATKAMDSYMKMIGESVS